MPYHEKPESWPYSLHEQLVLLEVVLVHVEHLRVVDVADQEKGREKANNHVDPSGSSDSSTEANSCPNGCATPEDAIELGVLRSCRKMCFTLVDFIFNKLNSTRVNGRLKWE